MIKTLLKQVKQYKKASLLAPLFTGLEVLMEVLIPFIITSIIDKGIEAGNIRNVYLYGAVMLFAAFLSLFFGVLAGRYAASASSGFACNLREAVFENVQTFSFSNIDKYSTAGLVTRMTTDITNIQNSYQMIIRFAVRAPLTLICCMIFCFFISAKLSLIFLAAIIVLAAALALIILKTYEVFQNVFRKYDDLNASVQENVSAIRVVKAFVREDYENSKFRKASEKLYDLFVRAEGLLAFNNPVMMLVVYGCIIALSWFGAQFVVIGDLTTGELTSMFSYTMNILMALMMFSMIFVMITMSAANAARIAEVLEEKPDLSNPEHPVTDIPNGQIDFHHVSFSYKHGSGEETLRDIDLHIKSGETIGIIGGTGCGKSRNVLFSGTILDNLRWGKEDATEEECREVCRQACADEFIERFPDKYNTWIEQGGNNVSGGQKQRLCIARALLKHPKILILDDSTSAVDTATDTKIREAFAAEIPGTTKLIIAQRISSVENADRILVLDNGTINGFDTHEALLQNNKIYQEIYEAQMKGGGDFDQPAKIRKEGEQYDGK
nr:ABC transporter ATP-binding protein [uncultured Anaerostipes sp.]